MVTKHLRQLIGRLDPTEPHYLGRVMQYAGKTDAPFISGGSGELLSQETVRRLGEALEAQYGAGGAVPDSDPASSDHGSDPGGPAADGGRNPGRAQVDSKQVFSNRRTYEEDVELAESLKRLVAGTA